MRALWMVLALVAAYVCRAELSGPARAQNQPGSAEQPKSPLEQADSLLGMAARLINTGRFQEALPLARRSLELSEANRAPDDPQLAVALDIMGVLMRSLGRYEEAASHYRRSLAIREKVFGTAHPEYASSLGYLAIVYAEQGRD